jgi:hypothetical protein
MDTRPYRARAEMYALSPDGRLQKAQHPELALKRKEVLRYLQSMLQNKEAVDKKFNLAEALGLSEDVPARIGAQYAAGLPASLAGAFAHMKSRQLVPDKDLSVLQKLLEKHKDVKVQSTSGGGLHYNPTTKAVVVPGGGPLVADGLAAAKKTPIGALAHEFGHARQAIHNKYPWIGKIGRGMGGVGVAGSMLANVFAKDEQTALTGSLIGSALGAPLVADELQASFKGSKALAKAFREAGKKIPLHRRMTPFVGVPSYLGVALMPLIQHYVQRQAGVYKKPSKS